MVGFDAEALKHADVEIAKWRRIVWVEGQVLAMLKTTTCQQHGKILGRVTARITEVTTQVYNRSIEQRLLAFATLLQLAEQIANGLHRLHFHDLELCQLAGVLAMVREIMMAERDALNGGAKLEPASIMVIKRVESVCKAR